MWPTPVRLAMRDAVAQPQHDTSMLSSGEGATCRICYSDEPYLIIKCGCRGSNAWVHDDCLRQWRRMSTKPEAAYCCDMCKSNYLESWRLILRARARQDTLTVTHITESMSLSTYFTKRFHSLVQVLYLYRLIAFSLRACGE